MSMADLFPRMLAAAAAVAVLTGASGTIKGGPGKEPILWESTSASMDYNKTQHIHLRGDVKISQGEISVAADEAEATSTSQDSKNSHWVFTDHTQLVTGSAGAWYQFCGRPAYANETFWGSDMSWCGTRLTGDMIYGSGLRSDVANLGTNPPYTQFNIGVAREFLLFDDPRPMTVRFDIVNLFDSIYEIRSGSGIGVFAPQFGPRRGYFFGVSKKL